MSAISVSTGLQPESYFLRSNGLLVPSDGLLTRVHDHTTFVTLSLRRVLPGGKGGFGAQLKGASASNKTTNFDACRDLHGRRLRDVRRQDALHARRPPVSDVAPSFNSRTALGDRSPPHSPKKRHRVSDVVDGITGASDVALLEMSKQDLCDVMSDVGGNVADAVVQGLTLCASDGASDKRRRTNGDGQWTAQASLNFLDTYSSSSSDESYGPNGASRNPSVRKSDNNSVIRSDSRGKDMSDA